MKNHKGFSLIELIIVVAVIGLLAAIAIPNLIASRRSANEGSAISSLRVIHSAEYIYRSTTGNGRFTADFSALENAGTIDATLGSRGKSGYSFALAVDNTEVVSFTVGGVPTATNGIMKSGTRKFCISGSGFMRSDNLPGDLGINILNDGDCSAANYNAEL